jgi:putative oxidoreductase
MTILARLAGTAHAVLRIGAGLLFLAHGLQKLGLLGAASVHLASRLGVAAGLETVGGALLVLGLFTRAVAAILLVEMLVAFTLVHLPRGGLPLQNGGELPLLYALIFAYFAANGAGGVSVDRMQRRS